MPHPLVVTGLGMISPVGLNCPQTCAALRAGIARFTELDGMINRDGEPVFAARIPGCNSTEASTVGLVVRVCREALASLSPPLRCERVSVSVLSNEIERPGNAFELRGVTEAILASLGLSESAAVHVFRGGNAGGIEALSCAQQRIAADADAVELIVGLDSLLDLRTLAYLEKANRLKVRSQPRGLIPGEAAACLLLQSQTAVFSHGIPAYCTIAGLGYGNEPSPVGSDEPCLGTGLTNSISTALEASGWNPDEVGQVYCDLNGEVYRAHEWMMALCRSLSSPEVIHPADCIGDIGAASAPLLIGMAAVALHRGYSKSERVLVFCSSDFGARGTVTVTAAPRSRATHGNI